MTIASSIHPFSNDYKTNNPLNPKNQFNDIIALVQCHKNYNAFSFSDGGEHNLHSKRWMTANFISFFSELLDCHA